ncbi:two-component sensor histidine kinase [Pseudomonas sp. PIC25]|uniref:ATP-binding protein n=1 Tax=Pseudomonas sp. PIC25 TaxID=1958773 RepID=UPI000BAB8DC9|nr:ATP-binding protein [Pseudomonas sp. PIC25]PAU54672.1 two-component sensor histidine kinase [Pseudomonas sp. PIC25]
MRSIRARTLLLVLGLLGVSLGLISWKSYRDAHHEIEELFDAQLAQSARLLQGLVGRDMSDANRSELQAALDAALVGGQERKAGHRYEGKLGFQVADEQGRSLLHSASIPADALQVLLSSVGAAAPSTALEGYHDLRMAGHGWRLFLLHDREDRAWLLVGERDSVRGELVGKIAARSLLPDLVGLPVLAILVWLAVGWGLRPLVRMTQSLKARGPDDLSPLILQPLPRELEPVVASLNRLLLQVTQLIEREKRFIADAAHELRTPLAVLRIHAQNAMEAADEHDRADALAQLIAGVDRTTRVVAQMLTLARLEPNAVQLAMARLDLCALARGALAELTPLALNRRQELTLEAADGGDYRLMGDAASLETLLQNLVGNALQYTPPGGQIQVCLEGTGDAVSLRVLDSGPGVPLEMRTQVFERFFRQGEGQGAGLGLSIVARVAELHRADVELLESPLGGLEVRVRFPREV